MLRWTGPAGVVGRGLERTAGSGAGMSEHSRRAIGNRHVGEPFGVRAVEIDLVDGLGGAPVAEFWRSVGGQDEEWDAAQAASTTAGR